MPLAVYGGKREIMGQVAPLGAVYQAGTLSGSPLAVAAGLATLAPSARPEVYERLEVVGMRLQGPRQGAAAGVDGVVQRVGSMLTLFFHRGPVRSWNDAARCDRERFAHFHRGLLARGVYSALAVRSRLRVGGAQDDDDGRPRRWRSPRAARRGG